MAFPTLRELRPPEAAEQDEEGSWDSTFQRELLRRSAIGSATICPRAVSVGSRVYGIATSTPRSDLGGGDDLCTSDTAPKQWLTWHRSLAKRADSQDLLTQWNHHLPIGGLITCITSNADGNVIAASTDTGFVVLLRGCDGQVIATRKVCSENLAAIINLTWIEGGEEEQDVLLIETPSDDDRLSSLIFVSNIQGDRLNHPNNSVIAAEAARNMQVTPLSLEGLLQGDIRYLQALTGCFHGKTMIRLVACDCDGKLVVFDYNVLEKVVRFVKGNIGLSEVAEWIIDFDVGLHAKTQDNLSFALCSAHLDQAPPMLVWFDLIALQTACHFELPHTTSASTKVMAIEPVASLSDNDTLAVAVAVKSLTKGTSAPSGTIHVVQVLFDETMGLTVLRNPHVVYTVPIDEEPISMSMACISPAVTSNNPYSFRYKLWRSGSDECVYKAFEPDVSTSTAIGNIRNLLCRGHFDQADEIVTTVGLAALVSDACANFHPSEIALHRLKHSLAVGSPAAMEQSQLCLRRLASGAVSGNDKGLRLLLEAVNFVIQSPSNLSLENFVFGLTTVTSTIQNVLLSIPTGKAAKLEKKREAVVQQIYALQFLVNAYAAGLEKQILTPVNTIRSPCHLFSVLIDEHRFALAEMLYRSNLRKQLTAEALVLPILKLSFDVKPRVYVSLLSEIVLPNLAINDDLLLRLKSWTCQVADALDDKNEEQLDLDAALLLLQTVDKQTRKLQIKIHSSFGSFSPFVERLELRPYRRLSSSNSPSSFESNVLSESSTSKVKRSTSPGPSHGTKKPIPTILELGALRRGATFYSAQANVDESHDTDNEDCVEDKLTEAQCLREARALGIAREVTSLRDFKKKGGAHYVAKELVRLLSASLATHDARVKVFREQLTPFCESFAVSEDKAMLDCTVNLCCGKSVSARAIDESCSIARCCSSATVRCHIALVVLRAALLCGYTNIALSQLTKDAISWASSDSGLQSELEEASRLLQIDEIVLRYCGPGARSLFRVDDPRHAMRLLNFVTKQVERKTVLFDALSLCDAFHHLSTHTAAVNLLEHAILHSDSSLCVSFMENLIQKDVTLSERALVGVIAICEEILAESSAAIRSGCRSGRFLAKYEKQACYVSSHAGALVLCAIEHSLVLSAFSIAEISRYVNEATLLSLRDAFLRIERLQGDHNIYVSLSDLLHMPTVLDKVFPFAEDVASCYVANDLKLLNTKLTTAKRVCSLLTGNPKADASDTWVAASSGIAISLIKGNQDDQVLEFLADVGLLLNIQNGLPARTQLSVALALCLEAANSPTTGMQRMVKAASLMKDWSILTAEGKLLVSVVDFNGHLDVVTQVFTRCDEGTGESVEFLRRSLQTHAWSRKVASNAKIDDPDVGLHRAMYRPILHSSWYIGDGLLLPPNRTLSLCQLFFRGLVDKTRSSESGATELYDHVGNRGAHSLALRVLCQSATIRASSGFLRNDNALLMDLPDAFAETLKASAERSLGGTGAGITSSVIDSQQAVAFLLSLPLKKGFAAYKSCIPTAVKTHNFERLFTLSNVGMVASSSGPQLGVDSTFAVGWKRQQMFYEQCFLLAAKAKWWAILREYGVEFDSEMFQDQRANSNLSNAPDEARPNETRYAASLMPQMIANMSKVLSSFDVLRLTTLYAETFSLPRDLVIHRHIEYLLSPARHGRGDSRFDPTECEKTARASLQLLNPRLKRSAVLRGCLVALDASDMSGQDYDLYNIVLKLYQEELNHIVDHEFTIIQLAPYEAELEEIDRRRDALMILYEFFQGDRLSERPPFSKFFVPLEVPFKQNRSSTKAPVCGILGKLSPNSEASFDPLQPLEQILSTSHDVTAVTALAPLCSPLGLPNGYIHARSLMARFHRSWTNKVECPSFENDVTPVLNRILSSSERAVLAEWCSEQYTSRNGEKLNCLSVVLQSSMQASAEIEHRRCHLPNDKMLERQEIDALERVKRISSSKAVLSDVLRVKTRLLSFNASEHRMIRKVSERLVSELDRHVQEGREMPPEALIDFLFSTGSLLAAQACLDDDDSFPICHLRRFCSTVHSTCQSIAEQYSHIDPGERARRFVQKWLFYGDESNMALNSDASAMEPVTLSSLLDIDEEKDTVDFVMDLSAVQSTGGEWGRVGEGDKPDSLRGRRLISAEEASVFRSTTSREVSEAASQHAALRVAFALAFSEVSHSISDNSTAKENTDYNRPQSSTTKGLGLLAQLQSKRESKQDSKVLDHSLELLRIVFAGPGASSNLMSRWHSFDSDTSIAALKNDAPTTITFAMRHRALRAASILCPQEALEEVIRNAGYLQSSNSSEYCSIRKISFGVFLAKEIEEMGLPLPLSDLIQLSSMDYLSYARALWRDHRENDILYNSKGRLLLLLVEMSLQGDNVDISFIKCLLAEMVRLSLPRTLLLSLEHIANFSDREDRSHSWKGESISKAIAAAALAILSEGRKLLTESSDATVDSMVAIKTFERLFRIAVALGDVEDGLSQFNRFADAVITCCKAADSPFAEKLLHVTALARERAERDSSMQNIEVHVDWKESGVPT